MKALGIPKSKAEKPLDDGVYVKEIHRFVIQPCTLATIKTSRPAEKVNEAVQRYMLLAPDLVVSMVENLLGLVRGKDSVGRASIYYGALTMCMQK